MYCLIILVECQCLVLPGVLEWSIVGSIMVLKSPAVILFVESFKTGKKEWKMMARHYWVHIVMCVCMYACMWFGEAGISIIHFSECFSPFRRQRLGVFWDCHEILNKCFGFVRCCFCFYLCWWEYWPQCPWCSDHLCQWMSQFSWVRVVGAVLWGAGVWVHVCISVKILVNEIFQFCYFFPFGVGLICIYGNSWFSGV